MNSTAVGGPPLLQAIAGPGVCSPLVISTPDDQRLTLEEIAQMALVTLSSQGNGSDQKSVQSRSNVENRKHFSCSIHSPLTTAGVTTSELHPHRMTYDQNLVAPFLNGRNGSPPLSGGSLQEKAAVVRKWLQEGGKSITALDCQGCNMTCIPIELCSLPNLKKLNASHNRLLSIPEEIGGLSSLVELDLSHNQIAILPNGLGDLRSLVVLKLNNNRLDSVPGVLGLLTSLKKLVLYTNRITTISDSICLLTNLQYLDLKDNVLKTIPREVGLLGSLIELDLCRNALTDVPYALHNHPKLRWLGLGGNRFVDTSGWVYKVASMFSPRDGRPHGINLKI